MNQISNPAACGRLADPFLGEPREIVCPLGRMIVQPMEDGSLWITHIAATQPGPVDQLELIKSLAEAAAREFKRAPIAA